MKTTTRTIEDIIKDDENGKTPDGKFACPLPLQIIPNNMGINLCSVEAISWTKQDDGQLVSLTIHFIPAETLPIQPQG
jgi:hypothetical protein